MFQTVIAKTPLTSDIANEFFANIAGNKYGRDNSFIATLRAIVAPRMKEDDVLFLRIGYSSHSESAAKSAGSNRVVKAICDEYAPNSDKNNITIHSLNGGNGDIAESFRAINESFSDLYPGYHKLDKVREFYRRSFAVECYVNPDLKSVMLFVESLDNKKFHYLQVSVLAFLPWYFDPNDGVSELEMELLYSLRETTPDKYLDCLSRIAEQYDFRTMRIKKLLTGFETKREKAERESVVNSIGSIDYEINELNARIRQLLIDRDGKCLRLLGLDKKISETRNDSEIMDYFLCNKKLSLENVTNTEVYFSVCDYLSYFDPEIAEAAIENPNSFVYCVDGEKYIGISAAKMKRLMKEIFVKEEPRLHIRLCAGYKIDLRGSSRALLHHEFPDEFKQALPNPHIDRFECLGNYTITMNELLMEHNYIGVIEQCIASCKSLNWGDSCVMEEFMRAMWGTDDNKRKCCIELPDGRMVTPADAILWLDEEYGESATHEEGEESTTHEEEGYLPL